jgi:hypothetical protein
MSIRRIALHELLSHFVAFIKELSGGLVTRTVYATVSTPTTSWQFFAAFYAFLSTELARTLCMRAVVHASRELESSSALDVGYKNGGVQMRKASFADGGFNASFSASRGQKRA